MLKDLLPIDRPAIRGQTHQLVFAAVHFEPAVIGERGVEQAQGMRELELLQQRKPRSLAVTDRCRAPFAHSIDRENRRRCEW
ncbi:hypothetical protein SDC9_204540 [bioreactor metagenome]|uniref:Uncharacterized protein n=1 Tax=bioreactor metagenome TaxID=1076179 RepID=A0A645J0B7_9ZZZZ